MKERWSGEVWSNPRILGKMGELYMTALSGVAGGADRVIPPAPPRDQRGTPGPESRNGWDPRTALGGTGSRTGGRALPGSTPHRHRPQGRPGGRSVLSAGVTWRELAAELKYLRFDPELVRELGTDPESLAARDRERFWYSAIALAKVDSREAVADAEQTRCRDWLLSAYSSAHHRQARRLQHQAESRRPNRRAKTRVKRHTKQKKEVIRSCEAAKSFRRPSAEDGQVHARAQADEPEADQRLASLFRGDEEVHQHRAHDRDVQRRHDRVAPAAIRPVLGRRRDAAAEDEDRRDRQRLEA